MTLADHLRIRRAALGLSQTGADRQMHLRPDTVRQWELGVKPQARRWPGIIAFLGYDPRLVSYDLAAD